jgi:hypothetical protein
MKGTELGKKGKWGIEDWRSDLFRCAKNPYQQPAANADNQKV